MKVGNVYWKQLQTRVPISSILFMFPLLCHTSVSYSISNSLNFLLSKAGDQLLKGKFVLTLPPTSIDVGHVPHTQKRS